MAGAPEITVKPNAQMDTKAIRIKLTLNNTSYVFNVNGNAPLRPGLGSPSESQQEFQAYTYNNIKMNYTLEAMTIPAEYDKTVWAALYEVWKDSTKNTGKIEIFDSADSGTADFTNSCVLGKIDKIEVQVGGKLAAIMNIQVNFPQIDTVTTTTTP